jgi:predicted ATP-grasp superfamily ATP-dependent carboligase
MRDDGAPNLLIQEYIPGDDDWLFNGYFDDTSRCLLGGTGRAIRQYPLGTGPTTLGETRRNEELQRRVVEWLNTVGYRGIVDVDLRFDPRDSEYKLLDVNPRIGSTFRLFRTRAGIDVARALYLDLLGESFDQTGPEDGRRWLVENYDVAAALAYRRAGCLSGGAWARSLRGVRELAWASLDDPAPAAAAFATSLRTGLRRARAHSVGLGRPAAPWRRGAEEPR